MGRSRKEKIRRGTEREIANEKEMSGKERNATDCETQTSDPSRGEEKRRDGELDDCMESRRP